MALDERDLDSLRKGANPFGKAAEIIVASYYKEFLARRDPGIVNAPKHIDSSVRDIRVSPDANKKDLLFVSETKHGTIDWEYNDQVKNRYAEVRFRRTR